MHRFSNTRWICGFIAVIAMCSVAWGQGVEVKVGMTSAEVIKQLGNPDGIKALHGTVLRDVADLAEAEQSDIRTVFIYERDDVRVWFQRGRVIAVTRGAGSTPPDETSESPPSN